MFAGWSESVELVIFISQRRLQKQFALELHQGIWPSVHTSRALVVNHVVIEEAKWIETRSQSRALGSPLKVRTRSTVRCLL